MKTITLREESYNKLVNEISHGLVDKASEKSDNVFSEMEYAFSDFYNTVKYNVDKSNPYVKEIAGYAEKIADILFRKRNQRDNFNNELNKFDYEKFYNDMSRPEEEEDYDNLDLRYLQDKYPR